MRQDEIEGQAPEQRHHIGPALRQLRGRRQLSIKELARQSGLSANQISRIERGRSQPSFFTLMKLAEALDIDLNYFMSYQHTSRELDQDLLKLLDELEMPIATWSEFAKLGIEARGALIDALRRLLPAQHIPEAPMRGLQEYLLAHGVATAIPKILADMASNGLRPVEVAHAMTQIEELPGDRTHLFDRLVLGTVPFEIDIDLGLMFYSTFGVRAPRGLQPRWWVQSLRSSLRSTIELHGSRVMYARSAVEDYARTGRWGPGLTLPPTFVRQHIALTIDLLQSTPPYRVGILECQPPFNLLVKRDDQALVYARWDGHEPITHDSSVGLRFSQADIARLFRAYLDDLWEGIPPAWKDSESIVSWLQDLVPPDMTSA